MLAARDPGVLAKQGIRESVTAVAPIPGLRAWTDDFKNLFQILR